MTQSKTLSVGLPIAWILLLLAGLAWFVWQPVSAAPDGGALLYAAPTAQGDADCTSWADACQLTTALDQATDGDEIWVQSGVHYPTTFINGPSRAIPFAIVSGVELYGGFAGTETTRAARDYESNMTVLSGDIDGNDITDANGVVTAPGNMRGWNSINVLVADNVDDTTVIDGFIVTAGNAFDADSNENFYGGGLHNIGGSPTLNNITFRGNHGQYGGGMFSREGSPTLNNVAFLNNSAFMGGGMLEIFSAGTTLNNVTFSNNTATYGGGLANDRVNELATTTLSHVSFNENSAAQGGGMYNNNNASTTILRNVSFRGNSADYGGGVSSRHSALALSNVSFSGNSAANLGGGIYHSYAPLRGNSVANVDGGIETLTLINTSFSGNSTSGMGGGIYSSYSDVTVINTIFWNNQDDSGAGTVGAGLYNHNGTSTFSYSLIQGSGGSSDWDSNAGVDGGNNLDADPLFVSQVDPGNAPTAGGNLALQDESPAINAGDNLAYTDASPIMTDLAGNQRIQGDVIDMGAFESEPIVYAVYLPFVISPVQSFDAVVINNEAIAPRPAAVAGEVFYTTMVAIPNLPAEGAFYLSANTTTPVNTVVDDEVSIWLSGQKLFSYDYSETGELESALVAIPRSVMEQIAGQSVEVQFRDLYAGEVLATEMYLIWVP